MGGGGTFFSLRRETPLRHCWDATAPCRQVGGTLRLTAALSSSGLHIPGPFRQRGGAVAAAPGRPLQVSASWWRRPPLRRSSDVSSVSQEDPQRGQEVPQGVRHRTQGPVVHGLPLEESLSALPGLRKRRRKSSRHAMSVEEKSVSTSGKMKVSIFFFWNSFGLQCNKDVWQLRRHPPPPAAARGHGSRDLF